MPILKMNDGVKIRVPDGVDLDAAANAYYADTRSKKQASPEYQEKLAAQQAADREEYDPTKGMSTAEKLWAGTEQGVARAGRGVANMLGVSSDEDTAAANELDEPLLKTGAGRVGSMVGNTAALTALTAPLGAIGGAVRGGNALTRTLAAGAGNVAAQGALGGAINADPGERGTGAAVGGVLGGGLSLALKGAGKLATGVAQYSDDAKAMQAATGKKVFVPLNEGLDTKSPLGKALKTFYGLASEAPISGSMLTGQRGKLVDDTIQQIGDNSVPPSLGLSGIKFSAEDAVQNTTNVSRIKGAINNLVAPLKATVIKVRGQFWNNTVEPVLTRVRRADPAFLQKIQATIDEAIPPSAGAETTAEGVLGAISSLKKLRSSVGGTQGTGRAQMVDDVISSFEELGRQRLASKSGVKVAQWNKTVDLFKDELWAWKNMERAIAKGNGKITPQNLLTGLKGSASSKAQMGIPNQRIISLLNELTVRDQQHLGGAFKTGIGLGVAGGILTGGAGGAAFAAAVPVLATKTAQRLIVGDFAAQKALAEALTRNPDMLRKIASATTMAATPEGN